MDNAQYCRLADDFSGEDKDTFTALLREGRTLTHQTLREAAAEFRTAPGTVSRWEGGLAAPPQVARRSIIELLASRVAQRSHIL